MSSTIVAPARLVLCLSALTALLGCPDEPVTPGTPQPALDAGVTPPSRCPECELCGDEQAIADQVAQGREAFDALTDGLPERPIASARPEATNGTLTLGVNSKVVPISEACFEYKQMDFKQLGLVNQIFLHIAL